MVMSRGVIVKEKWKLFCRAVCVESKSTQVVGEVLKLGCFIVFNVAFKWPLIHMQFGV